MIPVEAQYQLDSLARKYGERLFEDVQTIFRKYSRTGMLEASPVLTITKATDTEPPVVIVEYAEQGYFIGQKNPQWTKLPPIDELLKWGQAVEFAGPVPGYKNGLAPNLPPWKAKQRVVWAIAISKKKWDTHKAKPWKRQIKLGAILSKLNNETYAAYKAASQKILVDTIEGKI